MCFVFVFLQTQPSTIAVAMMVTYTLQGQGQDQDMCIINRGLVLKTWIDDHTHYKTRSHQHTASGT